MRNNPSNNINDDKLKQSTKIAKFGSLNRRSENATKNEIKEENCSSSGGSNSGSDIENEKNRYSDTELFKDTMKIHISDSSGNYAATRKFHSKSFSLSENRIGGNNIGPGCPGGAGGPGAAGSNVFQQNRELWEKRVEMSSQHSLTTPRILTRNRIAPDLVMDLPLTSKESSTHSSRDSLDVEIEEDMTSAERFAQNQSTLKKNERFSGDGQFELKKEVKLDNNSKSDSKPKAEVKPREHNEIQIDDEITVIDKRVTTTTTGLDDILHITEEGSELRESKSMKDLHKSPIPLRNTQKYVSQFADLHLTGGCQTKADSVNFTSATSTTLAISQNQITQQNSQQQQILSSFKPQVKVKPQILKKPSLVLPPTTPEMGRKSHE